MSNKKNTIRGITIVSLIITIIVLIILGAVTLYFIFNDNILEKTISSEKETNKQIATELMTIKISLAQINFYEKNHKLPTLKDLSLELKEDSEIAYLAETTRIASAEYDVISDNPVCIYTKLNNYPYEFEINSSLQLASVNMIATSLNNNKLEVIYVGELDKIINNNGVVTSTFDIKEIYNDYQNLTIDNFVYTVEKMYDHWNVNCHSIGGQNLKNLTYDAENGILKIDNAYQVSGFNSGFYGSVYLIPNIEKVKK